MHETGSFQGLLIVVACTFILPILLQRFRLNSLPVVVAEIIVGIVIGESFFNVVEPSMWLDVLSTFGLIFLMFLSGLEVDFSLITMKKNDQEKGEAKPLQVSLVIFGGIFILSYVLSLGFYYLGTVDSVFFMTLIISTISLGVVTPTLKENNKSKETIGQIILLVAIIADIVTMVCLGVFVGFKSEGGVNATLFLLLILAFLLFYKLAITFTKSSKISRLQKGTIHINMRGAFFLILIFVALSEYAGVENILGAFLAGVIVSMISPSHHLLENLEAVGYGFFIPIFFVMTGVKLDLISLVSEPKYLIVIPLLLVALFLSKFIPALYLLRWFSFKNVISSAALLTTTLSLVIAATEVGTSVGVLDENMGSTFILSAVITCLIGPIIYKKLEPKSAPTKKVVTLVGSSKLYLATSLDLIEAGYDVRIIRRQTDKIIEALESRFPITEVEKITFDVLEQQGVFESDVVVLGKNDDEENIKIGQQAKNEGYENTVIRVEDPKMCASVQSIGLKAFSTELSAQFFLQALIENPMLIQLVTEKGNRLSEVVVRSNQWEGVKLREIDFLGDVLVVRVYRGQQPIVPHGDTILRYGDKLLVSGTHEYIVRIREFFG